MVLIPPPLSASPAALNFGSVLRTSPGPLRKPPGPVPASPPAASLLILWPNDVIVAVVLVPGLFAKFITPAPPRKMLFRSTTVALAVPPKVDAPLLTAPPLDELLSLKVQFVSVAVEVPANEPFVTAPPLSIATLPLKVEFVPVSTDVLPSEALSIAAPSCAVLALNVQPVTVAIPPLL